MVLRLCAMVHAMEHQLSAVYDVTHGHGLAVLTPVWMRYILNDDNVDRFVNYGVNVFGISPDKSRMKLRNLPFKRQKKSLKNGAETVDAGPWNYGRKPL